jgi:hypothetical protein
MEATMSDDLMLVKQLEKETGIILQQVPLESPPAEIVKKGNEAIRQYFKSLSGDEQALNEVKVLLVGDGAAGKTSLAKALLGQLDILQTFWVNAFGEKKERKKNHHQSFRLILISKHDILKPYPVMRLLCRKWKNC